MNESITPKNDKLPKLSLDSIIYGNWNPEIDDPSYFFDIVLSAKSYLSSKQYVDPPTFNEFLRIITTKEEKDPRIYDRMNTLLSTAEGFFEGKTLGLDYDHVHVVIHGLSPIKVSDYIDKDNFGISLNKKNFKRFSGNNIVYFNNPKDFSYESISEAGLLDTLEEKTTYITPISQTNLSLENVFLTRVGSLDVLKQFVEYKSFREGEEYSVEKLVSEVKEGDNFKNMILEGLVKTYLESNGKNVEVNTLRFLHLKYNHISLELNYLPFRWSVLMPQIIQYEGDNNTP